MIPPEQGQISGFILQEMLYFQVFLEGGDLLRFLYIPKEKYSKKMQFLLFDKSNSLYFDQNYMKKYFF